MHEAYMPGQERRLGACGQRLWIVACLEQYYAGPMTERESIFRLPYIGKPPQSEEGAPGVKYREKPHLSLYVLDFAHQLHVLPSIYNICIERGHPPQ